MEIRDQNFRLPESFTVLFGDDIPLPVVDLIRESIVGKPKVPFRLFKRRIDNRILYDDLTHAVAIPGVD